MASPNDPRASREQETREAEAREQPWTPPSVLPDPKPRPGIAFRWVRTATQGQTDPVNVSQSFREGWQPVMASEHRDLNVLSDHGTRWPEGIEIGGLLLCSAPASQVKRRSDYYQAMTAGQMKSVNDQLDAEQDPRFRTMFRDHRTSVTKGFGPAQRRERPQA
jgi:hypothetical protein